MCSATICTWQETVKQRKVFNLAGEMEAVVVSQLAECFSILLSLRDTNTQRRGEERLPAAKLSSQLSQQVASFLCMQINHNIHFTAHTHMHTGRCKLWAPCVTAGLLPSFSPGGFNYVCIHGSLWSDTEKVTTLICILYIFSYEAGRFVGFKARKIISMNFSCLSMHSVSFTTKKVWVAWMVQEKV